MSRDAQEFISLTEDAVRAVSGPSSRHAALIEDAFHVLLETPGGGVLLKGDTAGRAGAKRAVQAIAARVDSGAAMAEADIRLAISAARTGEPGPGGSAPLPMGRRGAIAAKTAAHAAYLEMMNRCELVFGVGPAGTGKTFLAVAHGASLLLRFIISR